jgi:hypothetical protein
MVKVKVNSPSNKSWRLERGMKCWSCILTMNFVTTRTAELPSLRAGPTLYLRTFLGTHFCWILGGPQRYLMRIDGLGHLKIFNCPTRNRTPVLWLRASTNCSTVAWCCVFRKVWNISWGGFYTSVICEGTLIYSAARMVSRKTGLC